MSEQAGKRAGSKRSGTESAAILLLTLGESEAAEVLKHLGAKDVQKVGAAMTQLANVSKTDVGAVLQEFTSAVEMQTSVGVGTDEYIRKMLVNALGEDKASNVIDRILFGRSSKGLEALKWMDARGVAEMIRQEHPQIISIVLAYLEPDQSAEVLALLQEPVRADIIARIATLDGIQPAALSELDEVMEKQFAGKSVTRTSSLGGAKSAANILNNLEPSQENAIIELIKQTDEALAERIEELIFTFDDLLEIDDRGMQELLRQVPSDRLLVALKGADDELKQKIFKNMSQRGDAQGRSRSARADEALGSGGRAEGDPRHRAQARRGRHHRARWQGRRVCLRRLRATGPGFESSRPSGPAAAPRHGVFPWSKVRSRIAGATGPRAGASSGWIARPGKGSKRRPGKRGSPPGASRSTRSSRSSTGASRGSTPL
jgi:flagellar motor switch protein FliG